MKVIPNNLTTGEAIKGVSPLLCYFCHRQSKLRLITELDIGDRTVTVDGMTYGVCPDHDDEFKDLNRRKAK